MNRTALYSRHIESGARMTEFAGWQMPLFYSGVKQEHLAVRRACGIFDTSHMGQIEISGPAATDFCGRLLTNDISALEPGRVQYTLICDDSGGILDDLTAYKFSAERIILCVNAANTEKIFKWAASRIAGFDAHAKNISAEFSLIALQGKNSERILTEALAPDFLPAKKFSFTPFDFGDFGGDGFISRTGYTGEDGFEIFVPPAAACDLWDKLAEREDVAMCGLGSRDTLRLEMGYALYGNEISEDVNPFEANLGRYVKMDRGDFFGRRALEKVLKSGARRSLCAISMTEPAIARRSHKIFCAGASAGFVTSGTMSPSLEKPVGLAMIEAPFVEAARREGIQVQVRGRLQKAAIAGLPFYKNGSCCAQKRRKIF